MLTINKVIYNPPATIAFWNDGTKTTAKCDAEDSYSKELGLMLCILKKKYGKKWVRDVLNKYVYGAEPKTTRRGIEVTQESPKETTKEFRKPNVVKKRIKVNRPTQWLEIEPVEEVTLEIKNNDFIEQIIKEFFS